MNSDSPSRFYSPLAELRTTHHHLPHWDQREVVYFVTWRLGDSLPASKLREWQEEKNIWLLKYPRPWTPEIENEYHQYFDARIEQWLDAGAGECVLRNPTATACVGDAIRFFDGSRYTIDCFVIMPNHVHVLFTLGENRTLSETVKSWKSFSASKVNECLGRTGPLWQHESWDRIVRSERHFAHCREYIHNNPVKARLRTGEYLLWDGKRGGEHTGEREAPASR